MYAWYESRLPHTNAISSSKYFAENSRQTSTVEDLNEYDLPRKEVTRPSGTTLVLGQAASPCLSQHCVWRPEGSEDQQHTLNYWTLHPRFLWLLARIYFVHHFLFWFFYYVNFSFISMCCVRLKWLHSAVEDTLNHRTM